MRSRHMQAPAPAGVGDDEDDADAVWETHPALPPGYVIYQEAPREDVLSRLLRLLDHIWTFGLVAFLFLIAFFGGREYLRVQVEDHVRSFMPKAAVTSISVPMTFLFTHGFEGTAFTREGTREEVLRFEVTGYFLIDNEMTIAINERRGFKRGAST